jgi:hypothetical protein
MMVEQKVYEGTAVDFAVHTVVVQVSELDGHMSAWRKRQGDREPGHVDWFDMALAPMLWPLVFACCWMGDGWVFVPGYNTGVLVELWAESLSTGYHRGQSC